MSHYFPIALIVLGGVIYQLAQKSVSQSLNAYYAIVIAYSAGIVFCLVANAIRPEDGGFIESFRRSGWPAYGIGIGAVFVELGFLLAFRQGWKLSLTSIVVNIIMSMILVPVGVLFYKEKISGTNALGVLFYAVGLLLIARR